MFNGNVFILTHAGAYSHLVHKRHLITVYELVYLPMSSSLSLRMPMRFPRSKFEKRRQRFERGGTRARTLRPCLSSDSKASQTPAQPQRTQAEYERGSSKQDRSTPTKSLRSLMVAKSVPKKQQTNISIRPANIIYLYLC